MPLERQVVSIPLGQGMNTKSDVKQLQVGELKLLVNAVYTSPESITSRPGYSSLVRTVISTSSITQALALGVLENGLSLFDGQLGYSYSPSLSQWVSTGNKITVGLEQDTIFAQPFNHVNTGNTYMARDSSTGVEVTMRGLGYTDPVAQAYYYASYDSTTKQSLFSGTLIPDTSYIGSSLFQLLPTSAGGKFYAFFVCSSSNLRFLSCPVTAPQFSSGVGTVITAGTYDAFDTVVGGNYIFIVGQAPTTGNLTLYKIDPSTNAVTSTSLGVSGTFPTIAYDATFDRVWIAYAASTTVKYTIYTASTLAQYLVPTIATSVTGPTANALVASNGTGYFLYQQGNPLDSGTACVISGIILGQTGGVGTGAILLYRQQIYSKPFIGPDNNIYFCSLFALPTNGTYFLNKVPLTLNQYVVAAGRFVTGEAYTGPASLTMGVVPSISRSSTEFAVPASKAVAITGGIDQQTVYASLTEAFIFNEKPMSNALANTLHISGGILSSYDGNALVEHNFHLSPQIISVNKTAGGAIANGTYSYIAVFSWSDNKGQIHRSAPSDPFSVTYAGADTAGTFKVTALNITEKRAQPPTVELYRTEGGGTVYYLIEGVQSDYLAPYVTIEDINADADIIGNIQLYTTGGEVANSPAPATNILSQYKNRIFLIPSENPFELWYSKQIVQGAPVEFSELFVTTLDQRGGPATGLATLDDKFIIFKKAGIFYIVGDGPAPSGANNDFSYPQSIESDVGCIEAQSVVSTPIGVMFKSDKGIYLLDRSLQARYIGDKVEDYNAISITSARLLEDVQQVRFTLASGSTVLVYDYYVNRWSVFDNIDAVDALVVDSVYHYLRSDGVVRVETPAAYSDAGSPIVMQLVTGWLSFAKVQGFERVRRLLLLGDYFGSTTVTVGAAYDFDPTITNTASIITSSSVVPYQYRLHFARQKCETMQLTITVTPAAATQGVSLSNMALEVGVKKGTAKISAARSVG